jgi:hypothetical protein
LPGKWRAPLLCALVLGALRLSLLSLDTDFSRAFSHDSAYVAIVARNLLQGKGWVNDASWLVFLHPARLPMPYRNANPLYPLLTALAARMLGISVVRAGLLVAALASVGLLLGTFFLVSHYLKRPGIALLAAIAVTVFPPLWEDSLKILPDSLHLALLMAGVAFFVRAERPLCAAAAGILLGAAWLTRSTAALAAPALAVYAFRMWDGRKALVRLLLVAAAAAVVASPWLVYSARVWGSPFGSDSSYFVFQDFYARAYHGSYDRFWRSPDPPPSPAKLLRREGPAVVLHAVTGIPKVLRAWLREGWEYDYTPRVVFVISLIAAAILFRRRFLEPPLFASVIFGITQIAILAIRSDTVEPRYLAPLTAFTVLWLACGVADLIAHCPAKSFGRYALLLGCAVCAVYLPLRDASLVRQFSAEDTHTASWRRARRLMSATITHQDPVIVMDPYFYSYDTGAQALSIPASDDAYLLRYMSEYHSRWIMLTNDELRFWEPQWLSQLPSGLRLRAAVDGGKLFEWVDSQRAMPY